MGASGDLAKKKIYPSLLALLHAKLLPRHTQICGYARSTRTTTQFRRHLRPFLPHTTTTTDAFLELCTYHHGSSYSDWESIQAALPRDGTILYNLLTYLAIPSVCFEQATASLRRVLLERPLKGWHRLILEKPFGRDLNSCQRLLRTLEGQHYPEASLYRIDHYLGKPVVQNILYLRQNSVFGWLWPKIQSIHVIFKEPNGTRGRGGYFDQYGIIRDILQNHLLQVVTLLCMELPETITMDPDSIRDAKVKVLQSMRIAVQDCLLGQYESYKDDDTIADKFTKCPTYCCLKVTVENDQWRNVPIVMEAGKALDERLCDIRIALDGNELVLRLQPDPKVFLTSHHLQERGYVAATAHRPLTYSFPTAPDAYTKLVLECLRGNQEHFVRSDELIASWELFTGFIAFHETHTTPHSYDYGSKGPPQREAFLRRMGLVPRHRHPTASAL